MGIGIGRIGIATSSQGGTKHELTTTLLVPTIRSIHTDGDTVIALFDGKAIARDGKPYHNTYAWFMDMRDGMIVHVTAFYDSIAFDEFWRRVPAGTDGR